MPGPSDGNDNQVMEPDEIIEYVLAVSNKGNVRIEDITGTLFSPSAVLQFEPGGNTLRYKEVTPGAERPIAASFLFSVGESKEQTTDQLLLRLLAGGKARGFGYSWLRVQFEQLGVSEEYVKALPGRVKALVADARYDEAIALLSEPRLEYLLASNEALRELLASVQQARAQAAGTIRVTVRATQPVPAGALPDGGSVRLDAGPWQPVKLPAALEGVKCGDHGVGLQVRGWTVQPPAQDVRVLDKKVMDVAFAVSALPARVTISCNAPQAQVLENGKVIGEAGKELDLAPFQPHRLEVRAARHKPRVVNVPAPGAGVAIRPIAVELEETPAPRLGQAWTSPSTGMEFVWVAALKCWVGKYEVTNGEYRKKEPSHDSKDYKGHSLNGERQPVVYVNFGDACAYASWLTESDRRSGQLPEGFQYRLPSGDEWMTFAQCGDGREYPWGSNWPPRSGQAGNYCGQETKGIAGSIVSGYSDGSAVTCDVERSWGNPWGLYGVGGNVWECTARDTGGSHLGGWRVASWGNYGIQSYLRCDSPYRSGQTCGTNHFGFRLLLCR